MNVDKNLKIKKYISKEKNIYELQFENIKIEMDYSENCQNINECMLHILNQKARKK